jgi:hypothetical protein
MRNGTVPLDQGFRLDFSIHHVLVLTFKGGGPMMVTMGMFEGGIIQAAGEASLRIAATVVDKDGNGLGDLETIALRAVAAWEAEFVKAGMTLTPPPQRQSEYQKLSGWLQASGDWNAVQSGVTERRYFAPNESDQRKSSGRSLRQNGKEDR